MEKAVKHRTEGCTSTYVFSARRQEEVKKLYEKYAPPEQNRQAPSEEEEKLERLRRLDQSVTRRGAAAAAVAGGLGAAAHAGGIILIQGEDTFVLGTVVALVGLVLFLLTYPACCLAAKRQRNRVEPEILKLCKELLK